MRKYDQYVVVGDIGGTNARFGIMGVTKNRQTLLKHFVYPTQKADDVVPMIEEVISFCKDTYHVTPCVGSFAGAGPVGHDRKKLILSNASLTLSAASIKRRTVLDSVVLLNDFEALAFSINVLKPKDMHIVRRGKRDRKSSVALIGAGTGLGKSYLVYDERTDMYVPHSSEGGHVSFGVESEEDYKVLRFFQKKLKRSFIEFEDVVSGKGIEGLYAYVGSLRRYKPTRYTKIIQKGHNTAPFITHYKSVDARARAAFGLFSLYYARAARNFALDVLATGGVYFGGGFSVRHPELFSRTFVSQFSKHPSFSGLLSDMSLYAIKNEYAAFFGAAAASHYYETCDEIHH